MVNGRVKHFPSGISEGEFNGLVANGDAVVDIYTVWCGPCKMMAPIFERL